MKSFFREQVILSQVSRLNGEVSLVQRPTFVWLTYLISFTVLVSFIFLINGSYARKTQVFGVIQAQQGIARINAKQNGVMTNVLVREGELVQKGQALAVITTQHFSSDILSVNDLNTSLKNELKGIIKNFEFQKQNERERVRIKQLELAERITSAQLQLSQIENQERIFRRRLELNERLVEQISQLSGSGFISNLELNRQQDMLLSLQQQESALKGQKLLILEHLDGLLSESRQLPLDSEAKLSQLDSQIAELNNQITRLFFEQTSVVSAPISGTITGIVPTEGQTVAAGDIVLMIVPENVDLEAILYVPTAAVAFIETGQMVKLRFHAFPYERFGVQEGTVNEISQTVLFPGDITDVVLQEPSYRVRVRLFSQSVNAYGKVFPLRTGMTLDGDIVTEQRSLVHWILDPVYSIKGHM